MPSRPALLDGEIVADIEDSAREHRGASPRAHPSLVLHMAAQSLVRRSYAQPVGTFATNVMGTVHLLEALRALRQPGGRPDRHHRQGLRQQRPAPRLRRERPARRPRSLFGVQGGGRTRDRKLRRMLLRDSRHSGRHGARRQRHRRRRLVGRPAGPRRLARRPAGRCGDSAPSGSDAAVAARAGAARRLFPLSGGARPGEAAFRTRSISGRQQGTRSRSPESPSHGRRPSARRPPGARMTGRRRPR